MTHTSRKILAISGSLRTNSSTHFIIEAVRKYIPDTFTVIRYNGLASLPQFNDADEPNDSVKDLRRQLAEADGVIICSPEYAFGVPGALKNALDWTVSSGEFVDKPVAVITAATSGEHAHASLLLTLSALSANIAEDAKVLIPFVRAKLDANGHVKDADTRQALESAGKAFINSIQNI